MNRFLILLVVFSIFLSCNDRQEPTNVNEAKQGPISENITKRDIQAIDFTDYGISPKTEEATGNWLQYKEMSSNIQQLKDGDLSYFSSDPNMIRISLNDLKSDIPKAVNSNPIKARILVLETKVLKLNSLLRLKNVSKDELLSTIKETLVAMSHFNDQMNKKFEIENNNFNTAN